MDPRSLEDAQVDAEAHSKSLVRLQMDTNGTIRILRGVFRRTPTFLGPVGLWIVIVDLLRWALVPQKGGAP